MPDIDDVNDNVWELRDEVRELREQVAKLQSALWEYANNSVASGPFSARNLLKEELGV